MEWAAKNTRGDLVARVAGMVFFAALSCVGHLLDSPGLVAAGAGSAIGWAIAVIHRIYRLRQARTGLKPPSR